MAFAGSSISFADDSYTEYFSEEREFNVVDNALDFTTYLYIDEDTGYLYSHNIDTKEEKLIFEQNVTNYYVWNEHIYCVVDGKNIIKTTVNGEPLETILTTPKDIEQLYVNDDLIFYLSDNAIYRYHRESQTTDRIVKDDNIYFFYPYSSETIEWGDGKGEIYRLTDDETVSIDEYSFAERNVSTIALSSSSVTVHGTKLPTSNYPDQSYYTQSGEPCSSCHDSKEVCKNNVGTCTSCISYNGGAQCMAFAHEMFYNLWGYDVNKYTDKHEYYKSIGSVAAASEFLWNCSSGTHVRVKGPSTGDSEDSGHSIIIADVTTAGVYIYHANGHGKCRVDYEYLTFSQFSTKYNYVKFTYDAAHIFGTSYGYNNLKHWNECTSSNCNGKRNFESHSFTLSGNYQVCKCGYKVAVTK